ncbi:hypothetical protein KHS38_12880 [Mucilaginibacter sp. Bleaf8]|uniref:SGNH/GDSL hydrolase family protein n=1 Tax=Mucilaginibacter sp. Bleaf8 TaxID=2834430 RepID=UPI001BD0E58F|nr:SGNH/GDSL hydrolase family protein [Mucilaginibacter sp. Bleaf8]MBS7565301.1 hypothetical protein [Mucilaginibacter sp. Bleaf8]
MNTKLKFYFSWLLIGISSVGVCQHSRKSADGKLTGAELKPLGRYALNDKKELELISSAAHFGFKFTEKSCTVMASVPASYSHGYLQYELDGVYQKRVKIDNKATVPIVIEGASAENHKVWVYKATEAHTGPIYIASIKGHNLKAIPVSKAPLIEFIGNSITCGAAADDSEIPCGQGDYQDHHNAYMAYGPRVARLLGANYVLSSVSGIGVYRTWNLDGPSMPQVYEKTDFQNKGTRLWDFKTFTPKVVSIALGTNDLSTGDGKNPRKPFDSTMFINSYVKFIQQIKAKYPNARIALLSSPMVKGHDRTLLQDCLISIKRRVEAQYPLAHPVATFFFEPMEPHGCAGHPSVEDHEILAQQLKPFFRKLLTK